MDVLKLRFVFIILVFQVVTAAYYDENYDDESIAKDGEDEDYEYTFKTRKTNYHDSNSLDEKYRQGGGNSSANNETQEGSCNKCGIVYGAGAPESGRVINGRPVKPVNKYPWIVPLFMNKTFECGGALISSTYVMTAGHCVFNAKMLQNPQCRRHGPPASCYHRPRVLKVGILGSKRKALYQLVAVRRIIAHSQFNYVKPMHDIALLQLARPARCGDTVMPICLPPKDFHGIGTKLITAGFGWDTPDGPGSKELREGVVTEINPRRCLLPRHPRNYYVALVCAAGLNSGQASCHGDSGSALFGKFESKYYAVGVVSYGTRTRCSAQTPAGYQRVYTYMKFIKNYVKDLPQG